ncbi:hypothetical protein IWQ60_003458 [Tieghemiomyces parasiticus]|uniref:Uncharacterized protein n=1 Tax=Tieghemiomyces parasiticus TaxID=78921 RepID=A0A9W8AAA1_9FUNG|nr:hypothetical protein IWQ60_003458 [Tieghemiomyces parasiticus]
MATSATIQLARQTDTIRHPPTLTPRSKYLTMQFNTDRDHPLKDGACDDGCDGGSGDNPPHEFSGYPL